MRAKRNEKIMLKFSPVSIAIEVLGWILLLAVLLFAVMKYPGIERFPTGFSPSGEPTGWTVREVALVQPIISVILYVIFTGLGVAVRRGTPPNTPCPRIAAGLDGLELIKCVYLAWVFGATWCDMHLAPRFIWLTPAAIILGVVVLGLSVLRIVLITRRTAQNN